MKFINKKNIVLPVRKKNSHKGDNGRVLVVGGSKDYVGAVTLAGLASLRSGADLVKIIAPEKVAWAINAYSPDLITMKISGVDFFRSRNFDTIKDEIEKFDVLLIGNGIGLNDETKKFCRKTIRSIKKLKVIDADAIKSISMHDAVNSIITPHAKELEQFLINSGCSDAARKISLAKSYVEKSGLVKKATEKFLKNNNVILLKGIIDIVISKDKIFYNKTGNAGMTKGGTGDVLAGLCAGFLAQTGDLVQSAINGAYFNGLIGDILLTRKKGYTYLASDMVEEIERIVKLRTRKLSCKI